MYGPPGTSPCGPHPELEPPSPPYSLLNLPLVPSQNPTGALLKNDDTANPGIKDGIANVFSKMCSEQEFLQYSGDKALVQGLLNQAIANGADQDVVDGLQNELTAIDLQLEAVGCEANQQCLDSGGYFTCV